MKMIRSLWRTFTQPSTRFALGTLLIGGFVAGIVFWGGFNFAVEASSTETFCISCHEMSSTVYEELKKTIHYRNPSGVRATCPDCHVPDQWGPKMAKKVSATFNELPKHVIGYLNTREKFEAHRLDLAKKVWARMEANDSRNCRNCHSMTSMELAAQAPRARGQHEDATKNGETCIDCHKGIAHKAVHKELEAPPADENNFELQ